MSNDEPRGRRRRRRKKKDLVVEASPRSVGSVIFLHGFGLSPDEQRSKWNFGSRPWRQIYLGAPKRHITCYGDTERAWHDYFTDYGGDDGKPHLEEEIDEGQLKESRRRIHLVIHQEAKRYNGDVSRIALVGESQGACTALDAALTFEKKIAGVYASFGMLYSCTPVMKTKLKILAFHGSSDDTIAPSLALESYARLLRQGCPNFSLRVEPRLGHCESSTVEATTLLKTLDTWLRKRPPPPRKVAVVSPNTIKTKVVKKKKPIVVSVSDPSSSKSR